MTETKKDEQKSGSIDERLATMESESIKFPKPDGAPTQEAKPAVEEKKVETTSTPTVIQESTSQMDALKANKPTIAFVAGLIIGALLVSFIL